MKRACICNVKWYIIKCIQTINRFFIGKAKCLSLWKVFSCQSMGDFYVNNNPVHWRIMWESDKKRTVIIWKSALLNCPGHYQYKWETCDVAGCWLCKHETATGAMDIAICYRVVLMRNVPTRTASDLHLSSLVCKWSSKQVLVDNNNRRLSRRRMRRKNKLLLWLYAELRKEEDAVSPDWEEAISQNTINKMHKNTIKRTRQR